MPLCKGCKYFQFEAGDIWQGITWYFWWNDSKAHIVCVGTASRTSSSAGLYNCPPATAAHVNSTATRSDWSDETSVDILPSRPLPPLLPHPRSPYDRHRHLSQNMYMYAVTRTCMHTCYILCTFDTVRPFEWRWRDFKYCSTVLSLNQSWTNLCSYFDLFC